MKTTIVVCNRSLDFVKKNLSLVIFFICTFVLIVYSDVAYSADEISEGSESCYVTADFDNSSIISQKFSVISESRKTSLLEKKLVVDSFDGAECFINKEDFEKLKDANTIFVVDDV